MEYMRALVLNGPEDAAIQRVPVPVPGPGEARVEVHRVGVCGTDFELYTGKLAYFAQGAAAFPLRPGHEWAGRVSSVGSTADAWWCGRKVTGDTMLPCGTCQLCQRGRGYICPNRYEIGIRGGWPGALAEHLVVPVSALLELPEHLDEQIGALVEPGANAWRAAAAALPEPGQRVLVIGPGTIGLLTTAFAAVAGAEVHVIGLDSAQEKRAAAFGAARFWSIDRPPEPGFDAVVDCTDDPTTPARAIDLVLPGGRLVYIGVAPEPAWIDTRELVFKDVTVTSILSGSLGLRPTIEAYSSGAVSAGDLVGRTLGLDAAPAVLAGTIKSGQGTKIHIDPRS